VTFLLDTNVLSEFVKPAPEESVVRWIGDVDEDGTYVSVITLAELRRGIELLHAGRRKSMLESWLDHDLPQRFHGRVIGIDPTVADEWGRLAAGARRAGIGFQAFDGFIAATARVHSLTIATRNTRDFQRLGVTVFNPWQQ
jgi:predicted nucleic acid-binding protein